MIFEEGEHWSIEAEMAALLEQMQKTDASSREYQSMVDAYVKLEAAKLARDKFEDDQIRKDEQMEFEERKSKREHYEHTQKLKNERAGMWSQIGKGVIVGTIYLLGTHYVLNYEETGPVVSKAFQVVLKPWQNIF